MRSRVKSTTSLMFDARQLYNFVGQAGNILNMRLSAQAGQVATQAGMDSTAMKTMAVVTMVFLPPTFVAVSETTS